MQVRAALSIAALLGLFAGSARASDSAWYASDGVPDTACPAWTPIANVAAPQVVSGKLLISTSACSQNALYVQNAPDIVIPDSLVLEARLTFDSGSECVGPCGHYRQGAALNVTTAPYKGSLCFIGPNEVMLTTAECVPAATVAVNTSGAHTYTVVILHGTSTRVYQDGVLLLSGSTYVSTSDHAGAPRILWGEGSSFAYGTTRWESVRHNAHADGCATTGVGAGSDGIGLPRTLPNPFRETTTIAYSLEHGGRVRVDIFDVAGRRVRRLLEETVPPGSHTVHWDGSDDGGRPVGAGTYTCRVSDPAGSRSSRIIRIR